MGKNILVLQSGGSTPVMNLSLFGIAVEASKQGVLDGIYGSIHGLDGVLSRRFVDLTRPKTTQWDRIASTPGAALGSSRRKLRENDVPSVLQSLSDNAVRFLFIIGGNDSAETGLRISAKARNEGMSLTVIHVPKTIDNDLVYTDHSPGYGSTARFVALATMGAGRDAETMGKESPISVVEVMGRDAGWLAAAAALGKREEQDAPHLVCVPEVPVDEQRFLEYVENAYTRFGFAVAVVAENTRGVEGVLGGKGEPLYIDDFGHAYHEGSGRYLASLAGRSLKVRVRYEKPGAIQRSMAACVSSTDAQEAEMVGRMAVRYALQGASDQMVTLVRDQGEEYACATGLAPLREVAGAVRRMPAEYLDPDNYQVTQAFIRYATPLIGDPLPRFGRLV